MREVSVPVLVERDDLPSASSILHERNRVAPNHVAFGRQTDLGIVDVTTSEFLEEVRALAIGLVAAGVNAGDRVAIMSPTCYEWSVANFAIWEAGAVVVPVYSTAAISQVKTVLHECQVRFAFAGGPEEEELLRKAKPDCAVWTFAAGSGGGLEDLILLGRSSAVEPQELERRVSAVTLGDLASIVFTSGTTGGARGVRITHGNLVGLSLQVAAAYREVVNQEASTIVLLPLAHVLAQGLQLVSVLAGMKIVHEGNPQRAVALMRQVQPTFLVVVPRILEKILDAAREKAKQKRIGGLFAMAESAAVSWGEYLEKAQKEPSLAPRPGLRFRHRVFDSLFYRSLRSALGGKIDYLLSGASPLDADLGNFFRGAGMPVVEGYGLTETTAPVAGNRPGQIRAGSVGTPIPGSAIRISNSGEVLVKGVGVTPGYLDPADNTHSFEDGFYRTGDLGHLDQDGFLYIRGRLKNLIVTANGKNIAPEPWEQAVCAWPIISHAVMVGEGKPYASALIVLDPAEAISWAKAKGLIWLVTQLNEAAESGEEAVVEISNEDIRSSIQSAVDQANRAVSRAEQVRQFAVILTEVSEGNGMLTPTQKLRRNKFLEKHFALIEQIYNEKTQP